MKIDLDRQLVNADDSPATEVTRDGSNAINTPVTLRYVLMNAMLSQIDGDGQQIKSEDKIRRYDLWVRLKKAVGQAETMLEGLEATEFEPEDIAFLRKAALIYPVLVVGQVRELLK